MEGSVLQWVSAIASSASVLGAIKLVFMAGRMVEKIEDHERRIERLENRHVQHSSGD